MNNIQDAESLRKCAHLPCQCLIPSVHEYCSAYCSEADDVDNTELHCECGHRECVPIRVHCLFAACSEGQGSAASSMAAGCAAVRQQDSLRNFAN